MRAFTTYWKNSTWDGENSRERLRHTASNGFRKLDVRRGDRVYITTIRRGQLYVGARLTVRELLTKSKAEQRLGQKLWNARDHIIAAQPQAFVPDRVVPVEVVRRLRFASGGTLKFRSRTRLDNQTLRAVRELTPASARLLDSVLRLPPDTAVKEQDEHDADSQERLIRRRRDISATEKEALVQSRRGQGRFRADLERMEGRCRVTGVTQVDLLRASHIKPWAKCTDRERLDPNNGLLLAPHVDVLFELGYVTFTPSGRLRISRQLDPQVARAWGLRAGGRLGAFSQRQRAYLADHVRRKFKR
jgi:hypothetical protein